MSAIKFHKASEYKKVFSENGLARQSVLTGEYKDVAIYKCTLAAGAKWEPELYPQQEKVQILLFTEGTGYVATPHKAFQIEEVSVFVPRFDQESFFIQADMMARSPRQSKSALPFHTGKRALSSFI